MRWRAGNRLLPLLIIMIAGCGISHNVYWGDWQEWELSGDESLKESRSVRVESYPDDASVHLNGSYMGRTPLNISIEYPVLVSERKKYKYQEVASNNTLSYNLLKIGERPGSRRVIDTDTETRREPKDISRHINVRKDGYVSASKTISLDDTSIFIRLKKKLCIHFSSIEVENNIKLRLTEWVHDFLFKNKFTKEVTPEKLKKYFLENRDFNDLFVTSDDIKGCHSLSSKLTIMRDYSVLDMRISEPKGSLAFNDSTKFSTGQETSDFLKNLKMEINSEARKIYHRLGE